MERARFIDYIRVGYIRFEDNREKQYRIGSGLLKVAQNQAVLLTESIEEA